MVVLIKDGKYFCSSEYAIEAAYLMDEACRVIHQKPNEKLEIGHILTDYAVNSITFEEAVKSINEG